MRTSLNNIKETDHYIAGKLPPQETVLFEARLLIDPELADNLQWHQQTLSLVHHYGRNNLRTIINNVHHQLFTRPEHQTFRQKVMRLFK